MSAINPEHVAAKFNFGRTESPSKSGEIVWFLQAMSLPSGLDAFVASLVKEYPGEFQTKAMQALGTPASGSYDLEQCLSVWKSFSRASDSFMRGMAFSHPEDASEILANLDAPNISFRDLITFIVGPETTAEEATGESPQAVALRSAFKRFNYSWLRSSCQDTANTKLAGYLSDCCQQENVEIKGRPYCPELLRILTLSMDRHAQTVRGRLVETVVTRTIVRELEFAYSECVPVPIVGESRFGKTKSVAGYCEAYPGRARLVTVPDSNREVDFMRAHADALGIEYTPATAAGVLKDRVEFVLRRSGLMMVYDESHYLIPLSYHKATAPRRLNWVRAKVIDQGVPCAFFATPQSDKQSLEKYVQTTGYRVEQWLGRMAPAVILSDVLPFEEIVAVARKHFPELPDVLLGEIADRAILSNGHLKNVELAGRRARFLARERNHSVPTKQDVLDAIEEMMPTQPRVVGHTPEIPPAAPLPHRRTQSAAGEQSDKPEPFSRRGTDTKTLIPESAAAP